MTQRGRPSDYTEELADRICELVRKGVPVYKLADMEGMPAESTVYKWLNEKPEFSEKYTRAREALADRFFHEIIEIGDEAPETIKGVEKASLRCRNRIWAAERCAPKKYGARLKTELTGANEGPLKVDHNVDLSGLSDATLAELAKAVPSSDQTGD